jgi:hypothetical protein
MKIEKQEQLADERGEGERGGQGAESYDRKKAWSSINYSILSVLRTRGVGTHNSSNKV